MDNGTSPSSPCLLPKPPGAGSAGPLGRGHKALVQRCESKLTYQDQTAFEQAANQRRSNGYMPNIDKSEMVDIAKAC